MKGVSNKDQLRDVWHSFENGRSGNALRHHGLNIEPWWRRGSVEFRYFSGTFAFEKATAAVMMCLLTVQAVKNKGSVRIPDEMLRPSFQHIWDTAGGIGLDAYADKFFRDFLLLRSGACPAFAELRKYIKSRIATFYNNDGTQRNNSRRRR
jgi:hypothetical protein